MNLLKQIVFAGSMAIFASSAQAASGNGKDFGDVSNSSISVVDTNTYITGQGSVFDDSWTFQIDPAQSVVGFLINSLSETVDNIITVAIEPLSVALFQTVSAGDDTAVGPALSTWSISSGDTIDYSGVLAAGSYKLDLSGTVTGTKYGNYSFGATFTDAPPVPEPETYALMLAGLGLVGFMARRRKTGLSQ